jgi:hypothetical protein
LATVSSLSPLVEFQRTIDAMNPLVVPSMTTSTDKVKHLSKAQLRALSREIQQQLSDLLVSVRSTLISADTTLQTH